MQQTTRPSFETTEETESDPQTLDEILEQYASPTLMDRSVTEEE